MSPLGCESPLPISRAASLAATQGFEAVPVWGPRESDKEEAAAVTVRVQGGETCCLPFGDGKLLDTPAKGSAGGGCSLVLPWGSLETAE